MAINKEKIEKNLKDNKNTLIHSIIKTGGLNSYFAKTYLSTQDKANLARTCSSLYNFFQRKQAAQKLMQHVVKGEEVAAKAMIANNPSLLLIKTKAVDYSGRTICGTVFQAALGAEDERMWTMIKPYFKKVPSLIIKAKNEGIDIKDIAREEMLKQFNQQFPSGTKDVPQSELKPFYFALVKAITEDKDHGLSAIEGFRVEITKNKVIKSGKHFNMQHLVAACLVYIYKFEVLATWDNRDMFWRKVIGYLQRQMPANYAQAHCSGIQHILYNPSDFKRTFKFKNGSEFFPLSTDSGLGFDFGWNSHYYHGFYKTIQEVRMNWQSVAHICNSLVKYMIKKKKSLRSLSSSLRQAMAEEVIIFRNNTSSADLLLAERPTS